MSSAWEDEITEIIIHVIKGRDWLRTHGLLTLNIKGQGAVLETGNEMF